MVCIYCGKETQVINSRQQRRHNQIWRRRKCLQCQSIVTTLEGLDYTRAVMVDTSDSLQPFSRDKLFISIYEACKHRPAALEDATVLTTTIIGKLLTKVQNAKLSKKVIISITIQTLKHFDKVATVCYEAYHPQKAL